MLVDLLLRLYTRTQLFFRREDGASAVEYAIIITIVALVILTAGTGLGDKITGLFTKISNGLGS